MPSSDKAHRNALPSGYMLHWYRIDRVLGQGGFGITYLALDTNLDTQVAIKEYLPVELAVREQDSSVHPVSEKRGDDFRWGLERFTAEAKTLARFDHPNIVRVLSVFEANHTAYMVMRYEAGHSLAELLGAEATMNEATLRRLLSPMLSGLAAVHSQGFIHRDIKPANIFIRADDSPVVLDFGSARQALGQETKTLTTLVSPGYAPFEQYYAKSDRQGPWTDIYGLGATLYRAVVGKPPMDAVGRSEALLKQLDDEYQPAAVAAAGRYSDAFLAGIDRALAFWEQDRPQTVEDWGRQFELLEAAPTGPPNTLQRVIELKTDFARAAQTELTEIVDDTNNQQTPYQAFLGAKNADYYLRRFQDFDSNRRRARVAWHWPAALCTVGWLGYRRMYLWALLLYPLLVLATTFLLLLPVSIIGFGGGDVPPKLTVVFLGVVSVLLPGLWANAVYHRRAMRNIRKADGKFSGQAEKLNWLTRRGGTSKLGAVGTVVAALVVLLLVAGGAKNKSLPVAQPHPQTDRRSQPARSDSPSPTDTARPSATPTSRKPPADINNRATKEAQIRELVKQARNAAAQEQMESAEKLFAHAMRIAPGSQEVRRLRRNVLLPKYIEMGKRAAQNRDFQQTQNMLRRALNIAPDSEELQHLRRQLREMRPRR